MDHNSLGNFSYAAPILIPQVLQHPEMHVGHIVFTQGGGSKGLVQLVDNGGHLKSHIGLYIAVQDGNGGFAHNALVKSVLRVPPQESRAVSILAQPCVGTRAQAINKTMPQLDANDPFPELTGRHVLGIAARLAQHDSGMHQLPLRADSVHSQRLHDRDSGSTPVLVAAKLLDLDSGSACPSGTTERTGQVPLGLSGRGLRAAATTASDIAVAQ